MYYLLSLLKYRAISQRSVWSDMSKPHNMLIQNSLSVYTMRSPPLISVCFFLFGVGISKSLKTWNLAVRSDALFPLIPTVNHLSNHVASLWKGLPFPPLFTTCLWAFWCHCPHCLCPLAQIYFTSHWRMPCKEWFLIRTKYISLTSSHSEFLHILDKLDSTKNVI